MSDEQKTPSDDQTNQSTVSTRARTTGSRRSPRKRKTASGDTMQATGNRVDVVPAEQTLDTGEAAGIVAGQGDDTIAVGNSAADAVAVTTIVADPEIEALNAGESAAGTSPTACSDTLDSAEDADGPQPPRDGATPAEPVVAGNMSHRSSNAAPEGAESAARGRRAYWLSGAIAAGALIAVLSYRLTTETEPVPMAGPAAEMATSGQEAVLPGPSADAPAGENTVAVEAPRETDPTRAPADAVAAVPEDAPAIARNDPAPVREPAITRTASLDANASENQWGTVLSRFMNPFSYMRVASHVMTSVLQAWGVGASQPVE